eukprot:6007965-Amphidinium_carterae.1
MHGTTDNRSRRRATSRRGARGAGSTLPGTPAILWVSRSTGVGPVGLDLAPIHAASQPATRQCSNCSTDGVLGVTRCGFCRFGHVGEYLGLSKCFRRVQCFWQFVSK